MAYLQVNHPDKLHDRRFITERAEQAEQAYSQAIYESMDHQQASAIANQVLHRGLVFSPFNMLLELLQVEFSYQGSASSMTKEVIELQNALADIFLKYNLGDDYAYDKGYHDLYTELVGSIQMLLEEASHEL